MQLSSVRDLKAEIVAGRPWITARSGGRRIAIGAAPGTGAGDYRLAIRAREQSDLEPQFLEELQRKTSRELDIRIVGPIEVRPAAGVNAARVLAIGASAGHYRCTAGTIGFFARRDGDGALGIVSNNHVLAAEDRGVEGDDILHPGPADRGRRPNDVIAHLDGGYPRLRVDERRVDCAFAPLARALRYDPLSLGGGERLVPTPAAGEDQLEVCKVGRTTGRTHGRITAFELDDVDVDYGFGTLSFHDQIEIESGEAQPFCSPGDSGSLVFTRDRQPLGLLFSGSAAGGTFNSGHGYANPIGPVLAALGVSLVS